MRKPAPSNGFTLLEVLVASAILGIVMMVLLTSASTGLSLWRNTEKRVSVDREGRTALHLLAEDLAGILNFSNTPLQPQFNTNINAVTPMRFFTVKPADYQTNPAVDVGDVCFVEYRFENNALSRAFVDSAATFQAMSNNVMPANNLTFEVLATNLLQFRVWAWNASGNPATGSAARAVDYLMEVVDQQAMENYRTDPNLPLTDRQSFSGRAAIPSPR
jgi:prepilin-type N-terminal cleavage/methylation domain-containing protein